MNAVYNLLENITEDTETHAKWLNTLSLLEFIGSNKISNFQNTQNYTKEIMEHLAEETKHAIFFKKMSLKICPKYCENYHSKYLLCGFSALLFFYKLDYFIFQKLHNLNSKDKNYCSYILVSYFIELRALEIYKPYSEILTKKSLPINLKPLLKEEENHLEQMKVEIQSLTQKFNLQLSDFINLEEKLFLSFLKSLKNQVLINQEAVL